ncbi:MAG: acyltransferase [Patescibacteria group bacterium]|nr:acyltransferase [Patescibacteria group bacterium]
MGTLRIILAISVMIDHMGSVFGYSLIGGNMAVQSFFIISGFYMSLILNEKYIGKSKSYFLYISNRFLRIYPIYYLSVIATLVLLLFTNQLHGIIQISLTSIVYLIKEATIFVTNDYLFYIAKTYDNNIVFQSWSIGLEILFYFIAPFIVRNIRILLLFFIISILARILFAHIFQIYPGGHVNHFFPTEIVYFIIGALSYRLYSYVKRLNKNKLFPLVSILFICLTLIYQLILSLPHANITEWVYYLFLALSIPFLFHFSKNIAIDRLLGDLSYPVYLFHVFCINIFLNMKFQETNVLKVVMLVTTILVAFFVDKFISVPFEILRQKRVKKAFIKTELPNSELQVLP